MFQNVFALVSKTPTIPLVLESPPKGGFGSVLRWQRRNR
jgi:hypothetical protein